MSNLSTLGVTITLFLSYSHGVHRDQGLYDVKAPEGDRPHVSGLFSTEAAERWSSLYCSILIEVTVHHGGQKGNERTVVRTSLSPRFIPFLPPDFPFPLYLPPNTHTNPPPLLGLIHRDSLQICNRANRYKTRNLAREYSISDH